MTPVPTIRVAFDATPLLGFRTGIGRAVAEVVEAIGGPGGAGGSEPGVELRPYLLGARTATEDPWLRGAPVVRVPTRALLAAWSRVDHPRVDRWLPPADVVHATNFITGPSRLPTLVTLHDCGFLRDPAGVDRVVGTFPGVLRRALARGAHLHVTTHAIAAEAVEFFGPGVAERTHVVPFGVPRLPDLGPRGGPGGQPGPGLGGPGFGPGVEPGFVLALGTEDPRKDLPGLVAAFAGVPGDPTLVLAGPPGTGTAALTAALEGLPGGVRSRVHRLGAVDEATRRALLETAGVLAYPSRYEGFGFPALEGMVCGVPVVTTRTGGLPEVVGEAALLVEPGDVAGLTGALTEVLGDAGLRERLVRAGRARAAGFTWARTAAGLAEVYARLASSA